jgi:hypothetical protein
MVSKRSLPTITLCPHKWYSSAGKNPLSIPVYLPIYHRYEFKNSFSAILSNSLIVPDLVGENLSNLAFIFLCHLLSNFLLSDIAKFPVLPCAYKFQPLDISWWG